MCGAGIDRDIPQDGDQANVPGTAEIDDDGLRPDWRDAEFGGPFPDTIALKVLVSTVRGRVEQVRDLIRAPRRERSREDHHPLPTDTSTDTSTAASPDVQPVDPDEPPF